MQFPDHFNNQLHYKTIKGKNVLCVQYVHNSDEVVDIHLKINKPFFVYVFEGTIRFYSPNQTIYVEKGHSALINVGTYIMSEALSGNKAFKACLIFYSLETLNDIYTRVLHIEDTLEPGQELVNIIKVGACHFLNAYAESLSLLFTGNYESRKKTDLIDIKAEELMHYLKYNNLSHDINKMLSQSIDKDFVFKNSVKNNYLTPMKLEDLAFLTNMSLSSFKRKFKEIYNETPSKWIKDKKLEYAISLLNASKLSIKEVAYKCGFENATTFSRLFKTKYGIRPKDYK